jgi:hypothetical protein
MVLATGTGLQKCIERKFLTLRKFTVLAIFSLLNLCGDEEGWL